MVDRAGSEMGSGTRPQYCVNRSTQVCVDVAEVCGRVVVTRHVYVGFTGRADPPPPRPLPLTGTFLGLSHVRYTNGPLIQKQATESKAHLKALPMFIWSLRNPPTGPILLCQPWERQPQSPTTVTVSC